LWHAVLKTDCRGPTIAAEPDDGAGHRRAVGAPRTRIGRRAAGGSDPPALPSVQGAGESTRRGLIVLQVHRAERADRLAEGLAEILREPLADPFAAEVVSVPAKGVERWLAQRLSHRLGSGPDGDGVCANVVFPSVSALVEESAAAGGGPDRPADPWRPSRLVWTLLDVIDQCTAEPWCGALGAHLGVPDGDPIRHGRRYATARHIAELFDSYGIHRPEMVAAWSREEDVDGIGGSLPSDLRWQAELWRRLSKHMAVPSPAERLPEVCRTLREHPERLTLPPRVSIFGPTRLPAMHLAVLAAVAQRREVHLWLTHPSPALWNRVQADAVGRGPVTRRVDPSHELPRHPLLASLGRDTRELQLAIAAAGVPTAHHHHRSAAGADTLLGRIQGALARDDPPDGTDLPLLCPDDRSVQVHACHGADRQVEVLREVVLGLLADHEDLEPRDVLVMCPDIEAFAPLISASFGLGVENSGHPGHRMRVRLADRALRQVNPLLAVLAQLLELADSRLTAAQVLDFIAAPPVRRRFRLDDDDVERLRDLIARSGVRWGLDAGHRSRFRLGGIRANTWAAGLDRILLGIAMSEDDQCWIDTALPLDDVDSGDADLIGRLAEVVDRLGEVIVALSGEHPLTRWLDVLASGVDALTAVTDRDAWQASQVRAELADVAAAAADAVQVRLSLADVRSLLAERLRGRPTRANFRTGELTFCTMVPMRSVPHRVVCVLGLDDGAFPRTTVADGDDVLARDPCVGERDPRSEDRQLLLDAVLAATGCLVLIYSGADERTNTRRPPAVPLDELLDTIDTTVRTVDGRAARKQIVVRHPLQTFGARNFVPGALRTPKPFSFDQAALAGAVAAGGQRDEEPPFLSAPLPAVAVDDVVQLDDLRRFLDHPVRSFLRRRLGISFFTDDEDPHDGLPVELDALETWAVGDRLLRARLDGADLQRCVQAEWRRGTVPPGALGKRLLDHLADEVENLVAAAGPTMVGDPAVIDVRATLPGGRSAAGTVSNVYGDTIATLEYSRLGPKHRLRAWLGLLALTASHRSRPWRAVTIGRGTPGRLGRSTLGPVDPVLAGALLTRLVELSDQGLREPLPVSTKTSHAYAQARRRGRGAEEAQAAARDEWTRFGPGGEGDDPAHALVWGAAPPSFDALLAGHGPASAEPTRARPAGLASAEPTRFGDLATRLWAPLFDAETLDRP
jgi:exodeoxyribonuclease V gamma subunit